MSRQHTHVVILPYFCEEEVNRYLKIADRLATFQKPNVRCDYLLASSPRTKTSQRLVDAFSKLGRVVTLACPTQIFGYPQGPTAMFWDCMDFIAQHYQNSDGFGLWLESDMVPVKHDWLDRLSNEWYASSTSSASTDQQTPIMMGCYVPEVYKLRVFKKPKLLLDDHINGGACYAMDFSRHMPAEARNDVFDMAVFQYAKKLGRTKHTRQIAFSTTKRARRDVADADKVLLHGFMQDKDQFLERCLKPLSAMEQKTQPLHPVINRLESITRRIKVQFVRRGKQAMLENMFVAKHQLESAEDAVRHTARRAA